VFHAVYRDILTSVGDAPRRTYVTAVLSSNNVRAKVRRAREFTMNDWSDEGWYQCTISANIALWLIHLINCAASVSLIKLKRTFDRRPASTQENMLTGSFTANVSTKQADLQSPSHQCCHVFRGELEGLPDAMSN
jgi:hypothetical protein